MGSTLPKALRAGAGAAGSGSTGIELHLGLHLELHLELHRVGGNRAGSPERSGDVAAFPGAVHVSRDLAGQPTATTPVLPCALSMTQEGLTFGMGK
ncbi:hypothetical protein CGK93_19130 [Arthrobacter sp. YN]|nr:hypothetical protein CGK93_19130 [Arthrobacter sp. YN]